MPSGCEDFNILNILLILISGTLSHSFDKQLPVDKFIIYNKNWLYLQRWHEYSSDPNNSQYFYR